MGASVGAFAELENRMSKKPDGLKNVSHRGPGREMPKYATEYSQPSFTMGTRAGRAEAKRLEDQTIWTRSRKERRLLLASLKRASHKSLSKSRPIEIPTLFAAAFQRAKEAEAAIAAVNERDRIKAEQAAARQRRVKAFNTTQQRGA